MPVTSGSGNPKWTRDESLLALDLLYRHGRPIDRYHLDVVELSALLRSAKIYPDADQIASFRNADGVALKMQNLLSAIEPNRGLSFSKTDLQVVKEYPHQRQAELAILAKAIRTAIGSYSNTHLDEGEPEFLEGKILTAKHRMRDRRLRAELIKSRKPTGLRCEICAFGIIGMASNLEESFFEGHHTVPLSTAEGERKTRLADMSLLCACCHRFIHKLISVEKRWFGIAEAAEIRNSLAL